MAECVGSAGENCFAGTVLLVGCFGHVMLSRGFVGFFEAVKVHARNVGASVVSVCVAVDLYVGFVEDAESSLVFVDSANSCLGFVGFVHSLTVAMVSVGSVRGVNGFVHSVGTVDCSVGVVVVAETDAAHSVRFAKGSVGSVDAASDSVGVLSFVGHYLGYVEVVWDLVDSGETANGSVASVEIANDSVGSVRVVNGPVGFVMVPNGSADSGTVANESVGSGKIAGDFVDLLHVNRWFAGSALLSDGSFYSLVGSVGEEMVFFWVVKLIGGSVYLTGCPLGSVLLVRGFDDFVHQVLVDGFVCVVRKLS